MMTSRLLLSTGLIAAACGDDSSTTAMPDAPSSVDAATSCPRTAAAADRTRHVVVAHPYLAGGASAPTFEVLDLAADGTLTRQSPVRTFDLGNRAPFGVIAFTPDGKVGLVALDNGKLGVFTLDEAGAPTVVNPGFEGSFYASEVIMDPAGDRAWVVDRNTRDNGGGIYEVAIGCDGAPVDRGIVAAARSPGGLAFTGTRAVVPAREVLTSATTGVDLHVLDWTSPPTVAGGGDAFGDDEGIYSGFALSHDGTTAFIGDSNFGGTNRVGIVGLSGTTVTPLAVLDNITDPSGIVASPFGDVAVVTSSQPPNEGIYVLDKAGPGSTWRKRGELTYTGGTSMLPGDAVMVDRGQLNGRVLVSELSTIRQVAFRANGNVDDVGSLAFGSGLDQICGAIGVTP